VKTVIYGRVSTQDQDTKHQRMKLEDWANYNGASITKVFEEKLRSSTKLKSRKMFSELFKFVESENLTYIYNAICIFGNMRSNKKMVNANPKLGHCLKSVLSNI